MDNFKNQLILFKNYNISQKIKENDFYKSTQFIMNKELINIVRELLVSLKTILNIDIMIIPKIVLSSYLITYFSKDVLSTHLSEKEDFIFNKSKEFVYFIDNLDVDKMDNDMLILFSKKINTYQFIFNNWKKNDLESQINIYCEIYHDYKHKTIELEKKNDPLLNTYIHELYTLMGETKTKIEKLVGNDKVEDTIYNYTYMDKTFDDNIYKIVKEKLKKAFWNNFKEQIESIPPNYIIFSGLNKTILEYLNTIYNNNENEKFNEIKDFFIQIEEKLSSNLFSEYDVLEYTIFIVNKVQKLDSIGHDHIYNYYINELDNMNEDNFINTIVKILHFTMNRLEWISNTIHKVRQHLSTPTNTNN